MKRNSLTTAVLAGFLGAASLFAPDQAEAVHINPDGTGQALIFPLFTAHDGNSTSVSLVNTTPEAKAVRIRFMESINSRDVLGFNIYMGPFDVWTAAVVEDLATGGAKLLTESTTCTVPYFQGGVPGRVVAQEFLDFAFTGEFADGGPSSLDRTMSGFIEVIEMGVLHDNDGPAFAVAASKRDGVPRNCNLIQDAWRVGPWAGRSSGNDNDTSVGIGAPTGGLSGSAAVINVQRGTMFSYEATAISNFWTPGIAANQRHFRPNSASPDLSSGWNVSTIVSEGEVQLMEWNSGIEALNAVLIRDTLDNEFSVDPGLAARTDWVVTFPTRRFHTDTELFGGFPLVPFTNAWSGGSGCEAIPYVVQNRDQSARDINLIPSPNPPSFVETLSFCMGVNVLSFTRSFQFGTNSSILREPRRSDNFSFTPILVVEGFDNGWTRLDLGTSVDSDNGDTSERLTERSINNDPFFRLRGLPALGFAATTFTNGDIGGVLSNYGSSFDHRGVREFVQTDNAEPTADFSFDCDNLVCSFDGSASSDSDGQIVSFDWSFGDDGESSGSGETITFTFPSSGTYTVTLTVTDNDGATNSSDKEVTVTEPGDDDNGNGGGS